MDPLRNPFAPGAGTRPPELVGRTAIIEASRVALERLRRGKAAKSLILLGLRGVGKTVLLDKLKSDAEAAGIQCLRIEAPEGSSLPGLLAPQLRVGLLRLSKVEKAKELAQRGLRALAGFARALQVTYKDLEIGLDLEPEPGLADNGNLEADLLSLLEAVGAAARRAETALALFVDELQYVRKEELSALITALHRCAQQGLPVILVGAGLPQLRARLGRAKTYAERLFDFPEIGILSPEDAALAIARPLAAEGASIAATALERIVRESRRFPYFLQEWGKQSWDLAKGPKIRLAEVEAATELALAALDAGFFRLRFDRLGPAERLYLRAMAELGPGPHRSREIAAALGRDVAPLGPTRAKLIAKGMIYSPSHGDADFTVPLFDEFLRRIMPGKRWREG